MAPPRRCARGAPRGTAALASAAWQARRSDAAAPHPSCRRHALGPSRSPPARRPRPRPRPPGAVCRPRWPRPRRPGPSQGVSSSQPQGGPLAPPPAWSSPPGQPPRRRACRRPSTARVGMGHTTSRPSRVLSPATAPPRRPPWPTPCGSWWRGRPRACLRPSAPRRCPRPRGRRLTPRPCSSPSAQGRPRANRTRRVSSSPSRVPAPSKRCGPGGRPGAVS